MEACWLFKVWSSSALHWWREYHFHGQPAPVLCCPSLGKTSWHQPKMSLPQGRSVAACHICSECEGPGWKVSKPKITWDWSVFSYVFPCFLASPDIHLGAVRDVTLWGKLLVRCSTDIFRTQNPVYCILLHNRLLWPQGMLLTLLSSRLHNSNFFNFPSQDRISRLLSPSSELPLCTPLSWGHVTHSRSQDCSRVTGSAGDHGGVNPYVLMSSVHPHRVFALLCSGSARLTHAAVWFTLDPSLQSCHPDTCSPSYICAAGYSHLSKGKCVCTRVYMGATSIPEVSTAWCNPGGLCGVGRVGRERMQKDAMSVFSEFKTC